jgi:3-phosphoshikimate 1-carboxyvinyltransferase
MNVSKPRSPDLNLPARAHARGEVTLPGSKSISNRTLLLAALAEGTTTIRHLLKSDDTDVMLAALSTLGVSVTSLGGNNYRVEGCGGAFPVKEASLFLGNAGTAFRPLTAALAFQRGRDVRYTLDGVPRMRERPIGDLVEGISSLGTNISYNAHVGFPPLLISAFHDSREPIVRVRGDVSSQFLSALLMSLPLLERAITVEVVGELISKPYVDITLNLMARFGVNSDALKRHDWRAFSANAPMRYQSPGEIFVEGDASSASYFLAAGAIAGTHDKPVRVNGVGKTSIQGDVKFADALAAMGATVTMGDDWIAAAPPAQGKLKAIDADFNHIPDAAMTIAVLALFADGITTIRNIASWRVKETDRIAAMAIELRKVGATVEEGHDYIRVTPPAELKPNASIHTYDDHRMAMCFSLVSLGGVPITIEDPDCVAKTFPDYFTVFENVVG